MNLDARAQALLDDATAKLLIELAFLVPRGPDMGPTSPIGQGLLAFMSALEGALSTPPPEDFIESYHPCAEHLPSVWEGDGSCVICEGHRLTAELAQVREERDRLKALMLEQTRLGASAINDAIKAEVEVTRLSAALQQVNTDPEQGVVMHMLKALKPDCCCAVCDMLREHCEETFRDE